MRDAVLDARVRTAIPDEAREGAIADTLALVETAIGAPGQGLDGRLAAFFDAFVGTVARSHVGGRARRRRACRDGSSRWRFADVARRSWPTARAWPTTACATPSREVNALTTQIAELNDAIATAGGGDVEALRDRQQIAAREAARRSPRWRC